jgi:hypothetical protein
MPANDITTLLADVRELQQRHHAAWRQTAARFNVFDALKIEYKELSHTAFLAFLLNPREWHDQGDRYLRSFLALFAINVLVPLEHAEVITEHPIPPYGQLDLLVRLKSEFVVCIENKVGARDQQNQISRYLNWLNLQGPSSEPRAVVYLSPNGRPPQDPAIGLDVTPLKLLSYEQIADWLERQSFPDRLGLVAGMYVQTCRRIAGVAMKDAYADEIGQLLKTSDRFAIALDIAQYIEQAKPIVIEGFWKNVQRFLKERLLIAGLSEHWAIGQSPKFPTGPSWLAILPARDARNEITGYPSYTVIMAEIPSSGGGFYGIRRRTKKDSGCPDPIADSISQELARDLHFTENIWWCGWRYVAHGAIPYASSHENDWLVQCNEDNQTANMPRAALLAEEIWALFLRFKGKLEELNADTLI